MSFIDEIATAIVSGSSVYAHGPSSTATPVFRGKIPAKQAATAVGVYETGGVAPLYTYGQAAPSVRRPGAQVIVRSTSGSSVRTHADRIYGILAATVNSTDFISITPSQEPIDLGPDPDNRHLMSINLIAERPS